MPSGEEDEIPERTTFRLWLFFFAPAAVRAFLVFPTSDPSLVHGLGRLVTSISGQSQPDDETVQKFVKIIDGRIHALARAHNQITDDHWGPAPLQALIDAEAAAFVDRAEPTGISRQCRRAASSSVSSPSASAQSGV